MSRLKRKNRTPQDLQIKYQGGLLDAFDNVFKEVFRLTDEEYDFIAEYITDKEFDVLMKENKTFNEKRACLNIIESYIKLFSINNTKKI